MPGVKYESKPLRIEALQYEPPTGHDTDDGNIEDLEQFAGTELQRQTPWVPQDGQNCLLLRTAPQPVAHDVDGNPTGYLEAPPLLIRPGDYLVKAGDGSTAVADPGDFEAAWQPVDEPPTPTAEQLLSSRSQDDSATTA